MTTPDVLRVVKEGLALVTGILSELRTLLVGGEAVTPELARARIAKLQAGLASTDDRIDALLAAADQAAQAAAHAAAEAASLRADVAADARRHVTAPEHSMTAEEVEHVLDAARTRRALEETRRALEEAEAEAAVVTEVAEPTPMEPADEPAEEPPAPTENAPVDDTAPEDEDS